MSLVCVCRCRMAPHAAMNSMASRCKWTPYHDVTVTGWPIGTFVRGRRVMWNDEIIGEAAGQPIRFIESL